MAQKPPTAGMSNRRFFREMYCNNLTNVKILGNLEKSAFLYSMSTMYWSPSTVLTV